jgi:Leucine-rich repeat (LRR) protein
MGFKPERVQPDFSDLITSLNNSRNQIKDNPLYQTIFLLLQRITTSRNNIVKQIEDADELVGNLQTASYLTVNNESATLINSRRLLAGVGITFDDTVVNQRTISSNAGSGYWTPLTDGNVDETNLIFVNGESIAVFVPV